MKLETFFEKFDLFADAPNAVAKMRELVHHLAVIGKLVPQDPNDGPRFNTVALDHCNERFNPRAPEGSRINAPNSSSVTNEFKPPRLHRLALQLAHHIHQSSVPSRPLRTAPNPA